LSYAGRVFQNSGYNEVTGIDMVSFLGLATWHTSGTALQVADPHSQWHRTLQALLST